jgi:uncharacterized protein with PIN domain
MPLGWKPATEAKRTRQPAACRTLNRTCPGSLKTRIELQASRIVWQCPVCGLAGSIDGWEGTQWDRMKAAKRRKTTITKSKRRKAA